MSRVMVLGSGNGVQWLRGLLDQAHHQPWAPSREATPSNCDGLVVLDDGGSEGVRALQSALSMRESRPGLPVAVVRSLGQGLSESEDLARILSEPAPDPDATRITQARLRALVSMNEPEIRVRISPDAIHFEYGDD